MEKKPYSFLTHGVHGAGGQSAVEAVVEGDSLKQESVLQTTEQNWTALGDYLKSGIATKIYLVQVCICTMHVSCIACTIEFCNCMHYVVLLFLQWMVGGQNGVIGIAAVSLVAMELSPGQEDVQIPLRKMVDWNVLATKTKSDIAPQAIVQVHKKICYI